jgi:hypothetical protein
LEKILKEIMEKDDTIRVSMDVRNDRLGATEGKRLRWLRHVKRIPGHRLSRKIIEREPEGTATKR